MISFTSFADELFKIAATTAPITMTVLHTRMLDEDFDHSVLTGSNQDGFHITHLLSDKHYKEKGPAATVHLLEVPGGSGKLWEVRMMHVREDLRGKGIGKKAWNVVRDAHPNSEIAVLPDPVKDKAVSRSDLYKVYESYGFEKAPGMFNKWMRTFGDDHPNSKRANK